MFKHKVKPTTSNTSNQVIARRFAAKFEESFSSNSFFHSNILQKIKNYIISGQVRYELNIMKIKVLLKFPV